MLKGGNEIKSKVVALILSIFLGELGIDRFIIRVRMITVIIPGMTIQITIPTMYQMSWK